MKEENFCSQHSGMVQTLALLKESFLKIEKSVDAIRNRPPVWATALISFLTFLLGCSITYISMV